MAGQMPTKKPSAKEIDVDEVDVDRFQNLFARPEEESRNITNPYPAFGEPTPVAASVNLTKRFSEKDLYDLFSESLPGGSITEFPPAGGVFDNETVLKPVSPMWMIGAGVAAAVGLSYYLRRKSR